MSSSHQNLYYKLKEMDLSHFKIDFSDKIEVPLNVKKNMRFVGTEFERVFTSILANKYGLVCKSMDVKINKKIIHRNINIEILQGKNIDKIKDFNLLNFIEDYKCNSYDNVSFNEKAEMDLFIKEILNKVNFNKFKPRRHISTKIKFRTELGNINIAGLYGEIDLIIDDKIIDVKTDTILKLNNDYLVQLLYYYFLIKYSIKFNQYSNSVLNKIKINKICLYYACFDVLLEFDVKKIFKNNNLIVEIENLIDNNFINYNFNLREIIRYIIYNNQINNDYFENIQKKSKENQFKSYYHYIDSAFNFEINNKYDYNNEFLLQFIKINLSLLELRKSNSISIEKYNLIVKNLIFSFRNANNKVHTNKVLKLKDKHLFMSLRTYFKMNKNINILSNYNENLNKKIITKHIFETSDYYYQFYERYINIKNNNINNFNVFLKNWYIIYNEICEQKINKLINVTEFEMISDFIIKLLKFETKPNNHFIEGVNKMLLDARNDIKNNLITKKQFAEKHELIFKLVEKI
ncbi:MAG: hypothetical protein RSE15_02235 [Flavobacterium sp.]|uniref:hypothetical protein n=1 Tax=Flavobacterium sp. TaxID=239 RepID=UPI002B4694AA|nr:hypothetical protein [Flavobacterium sp.]WRH73661.1 MAG: hypothetical protein RSE15_02235 [Flavobacterium sp.]